MHGKMLFRMHFKTPLTRPRNLAVCNCCVLECPMFDGRAGKLGMDKVDHSKEMVFAIAMHEIEVAGKREEKILKMDPISR